MASPQLENGYLKIANELFDALCRIRVSGEARQVLDVIIRKTYGFSKKEDRIALSQICLGTGLKKQTTCKAINKLLSMNMITKKGTDLGNIFKFNKDFDQWKPLPKKVTLPKKVKVVTNKGNKSNPKSDIQKTKDNNTKNNPDKSGNTKKMKKNSFNYSEANSSDSYEDVIDSDSGEKVTTTKNNKTKIYWELHDWSVDRRGFKFMNIKKQFKAFQLARINEIKPNEMQNRWSDFEKDKFWKEKGFDWFDVVNSFNKKR